MKRFFQHLQIIQDKFMPIFQESCVINHFDEKSGIYRLKAARRESYERIMIFFTCLFHKLKSQIKKLNKTKTKKVFQTRNTLLNFFRNSVNFQVLSRIALCSKNSVCDTTENPYCANNIFNCSSLKISQYINFVPVD